MLPLLTLARRPAGESAGEWSCLGVARLVWRGSRGEECLSACPSGSEDDANNSADAAGSWSLSLRLLRPDGHLPDWASTDSGKHWGVACWYLPRPRQIPGRIPSRRDRE